MSGADGTPQPFAPPSDLRGSSSGPDARQDVATEGDERAQDIMAEFARIQERAIERGLAYTNLIMIAGYAGYFGLWSLARDYISPVCARWSLLATGISLVIFVGFEIAKMAANANAVKEWGLSRESLPKGREQCRKRLGEMRAKLEAENHRVLKYWPAALYLTLGFGMLGAGLLLAALILGQFSG